MYEWREFVAGIPLFSFLGRAEREAVFELFVEKTFQKGEVICRAGEEGDTFYIVLDGVLEVWAGEGEQHLTGSLGRGDFFGEMALLQGGKRMATVKAARLTRLLSLDKTSFNSLFMKNPKALEYFTRVLCKRLTLVSNRQAVERQTTTISVASRAGLRGKSIVASGLAGVLHEMTGCRVLLVRVQTGASGPSEEQAQLLSDTLSFHPENLEKVSTPAGAGVSSLVIATRPDHEADYYGERASNLVSNASTHFPFIVFDLGSEPAALLDAVPRFSDFHIELVNRPGPPADGESAIRRFEVINLFNPSSRRVDINQCEPFVLPNSTSLANGDQNFIRANRQSPAGRPIYRLASKILGATVGVALGGGAAFGISHLGVLKVLEQNNIPIDLVAGCSQGSIIGVGYAAGIAVRDMIDIAMKLGKRSNFFMAMDFTLTKPGILAGNRIIEIFEPMLGEKNSFQDLVLPCKTVATDIESGERVAIGTGRLADAFRASASVPMVMAPYKIGERALVDGGVADPVPAEVVNQMGADLCIAVNVVPPLKKGVENAVSRLYRVMNRFNPLSYLGDSQNLPSLFDLIMNSMQVLQYELGNFKAISADVLINPDLSDFTWIEYYRSDELIQRGVEAAERSMPAIKRAFDEKLAPYRKAADR